MGHFGMSEQEATLLHATPPNVTNTTTRPSQQSQIVATTTKRPTTKTELRPATRLSRTGDRRPEEAVEATHSSRMRSGRSNTTRGPSRSTRNQVGWGSLFLPICLALHLATSPSSHMLANAEGMQGRGGEIVLERHLGYHNIDNMDSLRLGRSLLVQAEQPDFVEPIGNHTVAVGRDAQLSCKITNLGNFRTAWLRVEDKGILTIHNNVITRNYRFGLMNNEDEQNFILTIKNVQPSDKGGYMCQINSVPMKYAVGYLDVLTPPVFDESSGGGGGGAGDTAAAGSSAATTAPSSDSNSNSNSDSDSDSVSTNEQAPNGNSSSLVTVVEGASVTLNCRAQGHPTPTITWRREDARPILLNGLNGDDGEAPLEIKDTNQLCFKSVSRLNSGAYLCIASNGVLPAASKRQLLDVRFSPIITLPEVERAAEVGQREARLECLVDLNPIGSYHWIKLATSTTNTDRRPMVANQEDDLWLIEHDELVPSDKFDIVIKQINSEKAQMILTIRQVERQDFSWYKCIAKNTLGLQSNFIRFYELPARDLSRDQGATATTTASSSFSLDRFFRVGGGGGGGPSSPSSDENNNNNNKLNLPQNDDSRQGGVSTTSQQQQQPRTRSSWLQRATGGASTSAAAAAAASSAGSPTASPFIISSSSWLLPVQNLLLFIYYLLSPNNCHLSKAIITFAALLLLTIN